MQLVQQRFVEIARDALGTGAVRAIVEVGARDCAESIAFAESFPEARVVAFECNPATLPACREAVRGRERVTLVEKAVGERAGRVTFYPTDPERTVTKHAGGNPGASSLFRARPDYPHEKYVQNEITVDCTTLAACEELAGVPAIDLLWMDIQGAELMALRGLGERIGTVGLVHLEVEFLPIYQGQPLFGEVDAYLRASGFRQLGFTSYSRYSGDAIYASRRRIGAARAAALVLRHGYLWRHRATLARHRLKRALLGRPG